MVIETPSAEYRERPVIAFAGGGTGGHLYPALAIAEALRPRIAGIRFLFFGTRRRLDQRILGSAPCELIPQTLPPLSLVPWRWPGIVLGVRRSCVLCRARLHRDRPAVVIGTGGLGSVPAVREAIRAGLPTVLLNPDALPGRANRHLARQVDIVFAQWAETAAQLGPHVVVRVSGCAVRPEFARADRLAGIERFDLDPDRKTLLVTGASQGARTINDAVLANLEFLNALDDWQVLHLTGERDRQHIQDAYRARSAAARVLAYTEHMADALAAADLVITRAGASTLAEITAVGRAAILMPYPFHKDMHQRANARCLVRASAARIVDDAIDPAVNGPALRHVLGQLMCDDERREEMASAARRMGRAQAATEIADQILTLAAKRGTIELRNTPEGSTCAST